LYWWPLLSGEKHYRIFPNLDHGMHDNLTEVADSISAFVHRIYNQIDRPHYEWNINQTGSLTLTVSGNTTKDLPSTINLWYAPTIDGLIRRDWRRCVCNAGCTDPEGCVAHPVPWMLDNEKILTVQGTDFISYSVTLDTPTNNFVAFVLEAFWSDGFTITSAPSILPQIFPYADCVGEECQGKLL
jgi:PhoPQ-activated pathogenicity-related protein